MSGASPSGYNVILDRKSRRIVDAWRPDKGAAIDYARTLSRTAKKGDSVYVEEASTKKREWTHHV